MQEAREFIKVQTDKIQRHLTKEHHKLVDRFLDYKNRTKARLEKLADREAALSEYMMREAMESSTKEAIYALDNGSGPLKLYNCLVPEIEAHRKLGSAVTEKDLR